MPRQRQVPLQLFKLAKDLGLREVADPAGSVIAHCEKRVNGFLREMGGCDSLSMLLSIVANKVGTWFEVIYSDADLARVRDQYTHKGEKVFANLHAELSDHVFGVTYRRQNRQAWEQPFVSVIDARGDKAARVYFTKWHEVAHLLTLTEQMRLVFRRTHDDPEAKSPEERLMDQIAGRLGFYGPIFHSLVDDDISFEQIESLRSELCPEASMEASLLSFSQNWPSPCILVRAGPALNKEQQRQAVQNSFDFVEKPEPVLRAISVTASQSARKSGFAIFKNMRVPWSSLIHRLFFDGTFENKSVEDLADWTGGDSVLVNIQARRRNSVIEALLNPSGLRTKRKSTRHLSH